MKLIQCLSLFILLLESSAFAQAGAAQADPNIPPPPGFAEILSKMMPMFAIVFMIFYWMVINPQQKKVRAQEEMLKTLKKDDMVVTSGGIIARVATIEEDCVVLDISNNVKLKVEKANVIKRRELKAAAKAA